MIEQGLAKDPATRPRAAAFGRALQQAQRALGVPVTDMTLVSVTLPAPDPTVTGRAATTSASTLAASEGFASMPPPTAASVVTPPPSSPTTRDASRRSCGRRAGEGQGQRPPHRDRRGRRRRARDRRHRRRVGGGDSGNPPPTTASGQGSGGTAIASLADAEQGTVRIVSEGDFVLPDVGKELDLAGEGSAFIIDPSGIAVTNNHIVAGAATLQVFVGGDTEPKNAPRRGACPSATNSPSSTSPARATRSSSGRRPVLPQATRSTPPATPRATRCSR